MTEDQLRRLPIKARHPRTRPVVALSLDPKLVARIDALAQRQKLSRSAVVEHLLRVALRTAKRRS